MPAERLQEDYAATISKLASTLGLEYEELVDFCGSIEDGGFVARRLKEFFKAPEITEILDRIAQISEQYRKETLSYDFC
ncbi:MAG: hypothetical protein ACOX5Q_09840 [Bacillota bacterium]|nr:hypothetical protein [Candidatus Fermentithermobacillaceae bacterium]